VRLDFNVLWVEDQPAAVAAQIRAIERKMAEEGFQLRPEMCTNIDEVRGRLADDLFKDEVDLILVDWELGRGVKGQTVITQIRREIYYKDIVFYSAVTDIATLKRASYGEGHEGVYFVQRDELVAEVTDLFYSMIKKVLDLDHTRGIVMGATSDVDHLVRECLMLAHGLLDDAGKDGLLREMVTLLDEKDSNSRKQIDALKRVASVERIIAKHIVFTAQDGLRILIRLLQGGIAGNSETYIPKIKSYMNDVIPLRNRLGHQVLSPEGRPTGVVGGDGDTIGVEELRELRKTLLSARLTFRELHGVLSNAR
jgi:hypothetical protein